MKKLMISIAISLLQLCAFAENSAQKTLLNLNKALRGETNASHRYEVFAQKASKEGYKQISKLFWSISMAESVHRNNHKAAILSLGGRPDVIEFSKVIAGSTKQNLEAPIKGEAFESDKMYPEYLKQAKADREDVAIKSFTYALDTETKHEKLFKEALANFGKNKEVDYCVSRITGDTVTIPKIGQCPCEIYKTDKYIRIK